MWKLIGQVIFLLTFAIPRSEAQEITLFIWEDYIADSVIAAFQAKTGVTVHRVYYDSDKSRDEILASSRGREFDVVVMDNIGTQLFGKTNRLLALTPTDIPNMANIAPAYAESCGNFGVPYFWGVLGLLYDQTQYANPPSSWEDLLDPGQEHQGYVVMIEDPIDILVPPLLLLGYNINTEDEGELKQAYALLKRQVPKVLNYHYALTNLTSGVGGKMHLALGYSGDQYALNEVAGKDRWQFAIPKEGTSIWIDCLTIPAWSKNQADALRFIDFVNDGQQAAANLEEIYVSTTNSAALSLLPEEIRQDPEVNPPPEALANAQRYRIISDASMRQRNRILGSLLKQREAQ